jgi:hypothetical protein
MSKTITMTDEQLEAVIAAALAKAGKKAQEDDDFQSIWRVDKKDYAAGIITDPDGNKMWLNIFVNKGWKKKKGKKGERPMYRITTRPYVPKAK